MLLANYFFMSNISILDQIINNQKTEEVLRLNAVEIVSNLFNQLSKREKDVLTRRFGLHGNGKETLESVGAAHGLTRERIRQIETSGLKKLLQLKELEGYVNNLKSVIAQLLEEHGGLMEREYLLDVLTGFSADGNDKVVHKSHLDFLISKLLINEFERTAASRNFKNSYKIKYQALDHLEELADELVIKLQELRKTLQTEELIDFLTKFESYDKHKEKFEINYNLDLSSVLNKGLFRENAEVINNQKVLYSVLVALKNVEQNKFGHWGIYNWREVKPKTINDKIYLVLKNEGKPLHFVEIAKRINEIGFDKKSANPATVHNELILDNKYVLVGRGLYTLKEWGYNKGTVTDVIVEVLSQSEQPLTREEIVEKVLEQRLVKGTTVILALMNKELFEREGNKYKLKK